MSELASSSAPPGPPPPTVFISYASGDREAVRLLHRTLTDAGFDVWLDEEELAGGEAWDAKIRRQIRTCTYFMPVISATTEARHEGYFRREWRFAVERTLDLADDVLFLIPVVIDDIEERGARVPEKFTTVQWLRCPGGRETPALIALARRLAHRGTERPAVAPLSPSRAPSVATRQEKSSRRPTARPFPGFPEFPAPGRRLRFLYELIPWSGRTLAALWVRLPRWLRGIATLFVVIKLIGIAFDSTRSPEQSAVRERITQDAQKPGTSDITPELKQKILQVAGVALEAVQGGRPLALIRFTATDPSVTDLAENAFTSLHAQLSASGRDQKIAVSLAPLSVDATDVVALARASSLQSRWLLTGIVQPQAPDVFTLTVKLYDANSGQVIWQDTRTGGRNDAKPMGIALANDVLTHVSLD